MPEEGGDHVAAAARRRRAPADENGELLPFAPFAFYSGHANVDKERVRAICRSNKFTPGEKFMVLWWIGTSPEGMEPVVMTGADIGKEVGMTADAIGRISRKLLKHRILVAVGTFGNSKLYRITPYIAFHGPGYDQREAVKRFNPPDIPGLAPRIREWWEDR
ncbi:replication initiation protein, RepL1 [Streptomyces sp. CBMA123]|nr:replication initiation protein, RepL1 [Streptomyces sp. CBMA123]